MKERLNEERRRKGEGRFWFDDRQKCYKGRIRINGKDRYCTLTANERESKKLWAEFLEREKPIARVASVKLPLSEVWPKVRAAVEASNTPANVRRYFAEWSSLREWLEGQGIKFMEDVKTAQFTEYFTNWAADRSPTSGNMMLCRFRKIWDLALPNQLKTDNPTNAVRMAAKATVSRELLTDEEVANLIKVAAERGVEWHRLIVVGVNTGLRLKDALNLTSFKIQGGIINVIPAKTARKSATRVSIPLNSALHEVLDGIEGAYFPELLERYNHNASSFVRSLRGVFEAAGIECQKSVDGYAHAVSVKGFHALRHYFVSKLSESGVSIPIIKSMVGHTTEIMTLCYAHAPKAALQAAVDALPRFEGSSVEENEYISAEASNLADLTAKKVLEAIGVSDELPRHLKLAYCAAIRRAVGVADMAEALDTIQHRLAPLRAFLGQTQGLAARDKSSALFGAALVVANQVGIPSTLDFVNEYGEVGG